MAFRRYRDSASVDGQGIVHVDALAAAADTGQRQCAAVDCHVAIGADATCCLRLQFIGVPFAVAAGGCNDGAVGDDHVVVGLDGLGCRRRDTDVDGTADQREGSGVFLIGGNDGFFVVIVFVAHLNAIVANARDVERAALHGEILITVEAVFGGRENADRAVLHLAILASLDTVGF